MTALRQRLADILSARRITVRLEATDKASALRALAELFDITATKDWANCSARATVVVDGKPLLEDVPATYLLFLEKQLSDLRTFIDKMVELDAGEDWLEDPSTGMYRTEAIKTQRTKKVQRPIVLYDATEHHPAQTQLITEDVVAGYWNTVKYSGAPQPPPPGVAMRRMSPAWRSRVVLPGSSCSSPGG